MVTTELGTKTTDELLKLAGERIEMSTPPLKLDYQEDVDLLFVQFSEKPSVRGTFDYDKNAILNYDKDGNLVSVEILDVYDIYASA